MEVQGGRKMKVWERIKEFDDAKHMTREEIRDECYTLKYCPLEIEADYEFVGDKNFAGLCEKNKCDIKCLEEYLDRDIKVV